MKLNRLLIIMLITLLTLSNGCWDRSELNQLAITTGLAFDTSESINEIKMTAQVLDLGTLGPASQGITNEIPFWNLKTTGETVFDCVINASMQSPHKLYLAHNQVVIFSEELARQNGVHEYIDFYFAGCINCGWTG
jgi:spore germination protein KC